MGSVQSPALCPVGKNMTETELNEQLAAFLEKSEKEPICQRRTGRQYRRRKGQEKSDRLLAIIQTASYGPHQGYVDWDFEGKTLLHTGFYIKYPKNSNALAGREENISYNEPLFYQGYFDGWRQMASMMKVLACMEIMFIAICLSTVFTVEHTRKTDQIILCSRFGKKRLYFAKLMAGLTVGIAFTLILSLLMFGIIAFLYGFDGYNTILQFVLMRPFNLTLGQAVMILIGLSFAGAILVSVFTMALSELTKNSVGTIGIIAGILILTMFIMEMPANLKILSEIWYMLPSNLVSLNGAFRYSMFLLGEGAIDPICRTTAKEKSCRSAALIPCLYFTKCIFLIKKRIA